MIFGYCETGAAESLEPKADRLAPSKTGAGRTSSKKDSAYSKASSKNFDKCATTQRIAERQVARVMHITRRGNRAKKIANLVTVAAKYRADRLNAANRCKQTTSSVREFSKIARAGLGSVSVDAISTPLEVFRIVP